VRAGQTMVYSKGTDGTYTQVGDSIDGTITDNRTGQSLSLASSGKRIAVAQSNSGASLNGTAQVYDFAGGAWTQVDNDLDNGAAPAFGNSPVNSVSMSLRGNLVVSGRPAYNTDTGQTTTHALARDPAVARCCPANPVQREYTLQR